MICVAQLCVKNPNVKIIGFNAYLFSGTWTAASSPRAAWLGIRFTVDVAGCCVATSSASPVVPGASSVEYRWVSVGDPGAFPALPVVFAGTSCTPGTVPHTLRTSPQSSPEVWELFSGGSLPGAADITVLSGVPSLTVVLAFSMSSVTFPFNVGRLFSTFFVTFQSDNRYVCLVQCFP